MKEIIIIIFVFLVFSCNMKRPNIECFDPNNWSADTSYYVANKLYEGFIFPANYNPLGFKIEDERFTPSEEQIHRAELILAESDKIFNRRYKRQYIGRINSNSDSLIWIYLLKTRFKKQECFDRIVSFGCGSYFEKYQRSKLVNLETRKIEY